MAICGSMLRFKITSGTWFEQIPILRNLISETIFFLKFLKNLKSNIQILDLLSFF